MFHSRQLNNKINRIHERALRIAQKDNQSTFNALLENDCSVNMHVKNLQILMTELLKTKENLNPTFMKDIFYERSVVYNLRNNNEFLPPRVRTVSYGTETIEYRGQRLWVTLPQQIINLITRGSCLKSISIHYLIKNTHYSAPPNQGGRFLL